MKEGESERVDRRGTDKSWRKETANFAAGSLAACLSVCPFSFLRQRPCACEGKRDFSLSLYRRAFVRTPAHIYAASSYVAPSERGTSGRERQGERREGGGARGEREGKRGGGRGTPCFDPRKRRRQSRRVLGSIPQGGRHSAALKPSASSFPPSQPLFAHPTAQLVVDPRWCPLGTPLPSFYREPPTDLPRPPSPLFVSLFRPLSLGSPCTRCILLLFLPFCRPPSLFSLFWRSLYEPLFPLSRNPPQKQKREAKAARGSSRVVGGFFCYYRQMLCLVKRGEERRDGERKREKERRWERERKSDEGG